MKKFSNIQDALDFAAQNEFRLSFPFTCKCNGFSFKVLSPAIARTVDRDRPTLVVTRNRANALELGYVVTLNALRALLRALSSRDSQYALMPGPDDVTVLCHSRAGASRRFSFPLAHRMPALAEAEGEYVLLMAKAQSSDWHRFWVPLESRLLHSSLISLA
jgi:hypothetical protein